MNRTKQLLISCLVLLCCGTTAWADVEINETNFPDENFRNWVRGQEYGSDGVLTDEEIASVKIINVEEKEIQSLQGIDYFTELFLLICNNNQLKTLDLSKNTALTSVESNSNQLTALDVSKNTALKHLLCEDNQLTTLDVSGCTALTILKCSNNQLTALDVSKNTELIILECWSNRLTTLDVLNKTALTNLYCYKNLLTSLDVSGCTALGVVDCSINQLKGMAMDALVESLPTVSVGSIEVIWNENEQNEMTSVQVAAAKAKGWVPFYIPDDANGWHEYEGSDPNGVKTLMCPNKDSEIWNLAGQRLQKVQRGVNVVGGKKVIMK